MMKKWFILFTALGIIFSTVQGWPEPEQTQGGEAKQEEFQQGFDQAKQDQVDKRNDLEDQKIVGGNTVVVSEDPAMRVEYGYVISKDGRQETNEWKEYIGDQFVGSYFSLISGEREQKFDEGTVFPTYNRHTYNRHTYQLGNQEGDIKSDPWSVHLRQRYDSEGNLLWTEREFSIVSFYNQHLIQVMNKEGSTTGWYLVTKKYFSQTPGILSDASLPALAELGPILARQEIVLFNANGVEVGWQYHDYQYEGWELVGIRSLEATMDGTSGGVKGMSRHAADLTMDGKVDVADLTFALRHLGERSLQDSNQDFVLDLYDVAEVLEHLGEEDRVRNHLPAVGTMMTPHLIEELGGEQEGQWGGDYRVYQYDKEKGIISTPFVGFTADGDNTFFEFSLEEEPVKLELFMGDGHNKLILTDWNGEGDFILSRSIFEHSPSKYNRRPEGIKLQIGNSEFIVSEGVDEIVIVPKQQGEPFAIPLNSIRKTLNGPQSFSAQAHQRQVRSDGVVVDFIQDKTSLLIGGDGDSDIAVIDFAMNGLMDIQEDKEGRVEVYSVSPGAKDYTIATLQGFEFTQTTDGRKIALKDLIANKKYLLRMGFYSLYGLDNTATMPHFPQVLEFLFNWTDYAASNDFDRYVGKDLMFYQSLGELEKRKFVSEVNRLGRDPRIHFLIADPEEKTPIDIEVPSLIKDHFLARLVQLTYHRPEMLNEMLERGLDISILSTGVRIASADVDRETGRLWIEISLKETMRLLTIDFNQSLQMVDIRKDYYQDSMTHEIGHWIDALDSKVEDIPKIPQEDLLNGLSDAMPLVDREVVLSEYARLKEIRLQSYNEPKWIDGHGLSWITEFWATISATFFSPYRLRIEAMKTAAPTLYEVLVRFYGYDPLR